MRRRTLFVLFILLFFELFLAGSAVLVKDSRIGKINGFTIRKYELEKYALRPIYFSENASRSEINLIPFDDITVAGYKVWGGDRFLPIDYVRIGGKIIHGRNTKNPLPLLYVVSKNKIETIGITRELSDIPHGEGVEIKWVIASGPLFSKKTSLEKIKKILRKTNTRPHERAERNAIFLSEDGKTFALASGRGTTEDMIVVFKKTGFFYLLMLDGGSSAAAEAQNPVYFIVIKKRI